MARALIGLALVVFVALATDLGLRGFAFGEACDWGFGKRLQAVQDQALRKLFAEPLPDKLSDIAMSCHSWTDFSLDASFTITRIEARALIDALELTYLTPQNDPDVPDSAKHRMLIGPPTHSTYVYTLPGVAGLQFRTVSVTVPVDETRAATVLLEGGTL
ncbi:MAG: hypothetical protein AAF499_04860 [Pseudomonadota bacterium]